MSRRPLDNYPTESALVEHLVGVLAASGYWRTLKLAFEPCSGAGQLARPLRKVFTEVFTNDIDKMYGADYHFDATDSRGWRNVRRTEWVITNPPYSDALPIIENALVHAKVGVAMLLRLSFLEPTVHENKRLKYPRSTFLETASDQLRFLIPIGGPRPSFTNDGKTDSVTVAWYVWDKGWSWKDTDIAPPFQFVANWRKHDVDN